MERFVSGQLIAGYIPADKNNKLRVQHPMVTLTFKCDNGGTLQLYAAERVDAKAVYKYLSADIKVSKGWSKPLLLRGES